MSKTVIILVLFMFTAVGCSFVDPLTKAQSLIQKGKFQEAIKILEQESKAQPSSVPLKTLLAQAYSDYGLALCQDQNKPPKVKYPMAKENFAMALAINPNLQDAREMFRMIEEIQSSLSNDKE